MSDYENCGSVFTYEQKARLLALLVKDESIVMLLSALEGNRTIDLTDPDHDPKLREFHNAVTKILFRWKVSP